MNNTDTLGKVLDAIDRGLRCTVEDFLGTELYEQAMMEAGGKWRLLMEEIKREREAEE